MTGNADKGTLESRQDFEDNPSEQYRYWSRELGASDKQLRQFRKLGTKIVHRYLGGGKGTTDKSDEGARNGTFRLNLFHSNVITLQSMLYVDLPQVVVSRRFDDPNDDVGRVCSDILERLLNNDIQENGKELECTLKAVLQDRLLPGLGVARVRYEVETDTDPNTGEEFVTFEDVPIDYYHWRDVSWGWGRSFSDLPWVGFRTWLKKDAVRERFGDEAADGVQLKDEAVVNNKTEEASAPDEDSPWRKAEIWEIWDKEARKIVWMSPGYDKVLDTRDDTLGLTGFYPCSPFLLANQTTSLYIPVSDFYLAQDLYNEVDVLQTRISIITEAVKVVGLYDKSSMDISRMFKEGTDNDLIPVDNWALFAEKGGIAGQIDWVPMGEITESLLRLRELRDEAIGLLQQVTGMSDIMRGELGGQYEGVGQTQIKAKFGSVRVQALQDDLGKFASDLLQLKAEVISRHFEPETIARRANLDHTFDEELIPQAIQLLKDPEQARLRVKVKPESVGMVDYAQLKQERTEYIGAIASFFQSVGPVMVEEPGTKPFFLEILKWGLAGFKGSNSIESVMDKAIEMSNQAAIVNPGDEEDNKDAEKERVKSQAQMELENLKHQNALQLIQAKMQADAQTRETDRQADISTKQNESQMSMQVSEMEMRASLAEIRAKAASDIQVEQSQSQMNAAQQEAGVQAEVKKEGVVTALEMESMETQARINYEAAEHEARLAKEEAVHQAGLDIKIAKAQPKPTGGTSDKSSKGS
jgi:hypothetical protein